jgi:hypothetical protein
LQPNNKPHTGSYKRSDEFLKNIINLNSHRRLVAHRNCPGSSSHPIFANIARDISKMKANLLIAA